MLTRPRPPAHLLDGDGAVTPTPVELAHELHDWLRATFIDEGAPLLNEDHVHLRDARLGVLWCSLPNERQGNTVVGLCEEATFIGNRWAKARWAQQIEGWFGTVPNFLLTFHADYADQCSDAAFCALVGARALSRGPSQGPVGLAALLEDDGPAGLRPRGHDVEEFVGIVERYGVGNGAGKTAALVAAANRTPIICEADITVACGTCGRGLTGP